MSQSMREIVCDILTRDAAGETLEEMVSALEDIRSAAPEEAARVCDDRDRFWTELGEAAAELNHSSAYHQGCADASRKLAAAIRARKSKEAKHESK